MYLLDTNIVSELRKNRPHGAVLAWLKNIPDADLAISVVTMAEIQAGIEITRKRDPQKAMEIERWLDQVEKTYNVVPLDSAILRIWAQLMHEQSDTLYEDAMIAATAIRNHLTIVTRNVRDFEIFQVPVFDPFSN